MLISAPLLPRRNKFHLQITTTKQTAARTPLIAVLSFAIQCSDAFHRNKLKSISGIIDDKYTKHRWQ